MILIKTEYWQVIKKVLGRAEDVDNKVSEGDKDFWHELDELHQAVSEYRIIKPIVEKGYDAQN